MPYRRALPYRRVPQSGVSLYNYPLSNYNHPLSNFTISFPFDYRTKALMLYPDVVPCCCTLLLYPEDPDVECRHCILTMYPNIVS